MGRCGTVDQPQLAIPFVIRAKPAGQWKRKLRSGPPASSTSTEASGFSLSRRFRHDAACGSGPRNDEVEFSAEACHGPAFATLPELTEVLRNPSRSSVYRRLKTLGYLASYTHAGAHYTLPEIPDFDEAGLWWHQGIGFSKCGNLKDTIAAWVGHSAAGYTLNELEAPLKLRVQNAPLALVREGTITRNAFDGVYVYLSGDPVRAEEQMAARHQFRAIRTGGALPGELVIDVLATAIRGHQGASRSAAGDDFAHHLAKCDIRQGGIPRCPSTSARSMRASSTGPVAAASGWSSPANSTASLRRTASSVLT